MVPPDDPRGRRRPHDALGPPAATRGPEASGARAAPDGPAQGRARPWCGCTRRRSTRGELDWPSTAFPATPSYELSGVVSALGQGVEGVAVGEPVYAAHRFDRDGAAAD